MPLKDMNIPKCKAKHTVALGMLKIIDEGESHDGNLTSLFLNFVDEEALEGGDSSLPSVKDALRDLFLYDDEGNLDRDKLRQRCLEVSRIYQLMLTISLAENTAALDHLYDQLAETLDALFKDIFSSC